MGVVTNNGVLGSFSIYGHLKLYMGVSSIVGV